MDTYAFLAVPPAASPIVAGAAFEAIPGFSISKTIAAGNKAKISIVGSLNLQYFYGDICQITLWRQIADGPFVDLTPPNVSSLDGERAINSDEMRRYAISLIDVELALTEPQAVTYQLAAKSNNGNVWFGRRFDNTDKLRSGTTFILEEIGG
ncbi:hypothetical protein [Bradyrhizobium sp. AUGA SZCCT0160]|uniref:hypothetical protein n=1 Tax=Bradyrhizobium sp. AUGA SZCCT0160 TaxID=2807662 RepID=UPI001BA46862|nr:hypothetical protein [Bradyrhizobium sp. AUGA SZCCT0160]MBR1193246.1 hypothetical protein [Bradyrhizobium sp. AUGA SZCCT0160]